MSFTDITVQLPEQPGVMGKLGTAFANAGVNIEGICGGGGYYHFCFKDADAACKVLDQTGYTYQNQQECLCETVPDRAGVLGECCTALGNAGINIDCIYLATDTRIVVCCQDLEAARQAWSKTAALR